MSDLVAKAKAFATSVHAEQFRRYTEEPFMVHPENVARLVSGVTTDPVVIAAAWLHDVVEDTDAEFEEVRNVFGSEVFSLVFFLTAPDVPGNREFRKEVQRLLISVAPANAQTIKLADILDNLPSIIEYDPKFAAVYVDEKAEMLKVIQRGDSRLGSQVAKILADYYQHHEH